MPLQEYKGYYVDYRLRQFRTISQPFEPIQFIDFKSDEGDKLLCEMLAAGLVPDDKKHYVL